MAEAVYLTCAVASIACAVLLQRGYRKERMRLLFWSSLCFAGLALNNVLLFVDLSVVSSVDLSMLRNTVALVALALLLIGLVWEQR
jgi:hypothetical protein